MITPNHKFFAFKNNLFRPSVRNTTSLLSAAANLTPTELLRLQNERIAGILTHAYDTTAFYRRLYSSAGFTRKDLQQQGVLENLPTLTRKHVKENFDGLISDSISRNRLGRSSTGGSTGTPLTVGTDPHIAPEVISWRTLRSWGADPSDNAGYIYRAIPTGGAAIARRIFYFPTRRAYLSATNMSEAQMNDFALRLATMRARYLVGYVGALKIFAEFLEANNVKLPTLKFIWSTAAPLPVNLRMYLESVFRVPVYSQYGSCEFYWIAAERKDRAGLNVDWDIRHVEILDTNNQAAAEGEYGQIVVTDLINQAFPLIRYEIGDRSRLMPSPSEEGVQILDFVSGRTSDTIKLKNGMNISGEFWTTVFDDYADEIKSFHIHQTKDFAITVSFVPTAKWSKETEKKLSSSLRAVARGTPMQLRSEAVDNLDRGKLSFVSSDLGKT